MRLGSNTYRIFAFFDYVGTLILTHGYSKKSSKTDPRQIRQAEAYRRDHLEPR